MTNNGKREEEALLYSHFANLQDCSDDKAVRASLILNAILLVRRTRGVHITMRRGASRTAIIITTWKAKSHVIFLLVLFDFVLSLCEKCLFGRQHNTYNIYSSPDFLLVKCS